MVRSISRCQRVNSDIYIRVARDRWNADFPTATEVYFSPRDIYFCSRELKIAKGSIESIELFRCRKNSAVKNCHFLQFDSQLNVWRSARDGKKIKNYLAVYKQMEVTLSYVLAKFLLLYLFPIIMSINKFFISHKSVINVENSRRKRLMRHVSWFIEYSLRKINSSKNLLFENLPFLQILTCLMLPWRMNNNINNIIRLMSHSTFFYGETYTCTTRAVALENCDPE